MRRNRSGDTQGDQENAVHSRTPEVDRTPTKVARQDPREHDENHLQGRGDKTQGERSVRIYASLFRDQSAYAFTYDEKL